MAVRKLKCLVILSLALLTVDAKAEPGAAPPTAETAIGAALDPFVANQQLAGYVTVLMKDGKHIATNVRGHADIETRRPMKKDTIFNLKGAFNLCQAALRHFVQQKSGTIVNLASLASQRGSGLVGGAHNAAAKGGVISLTRSIAREFGPQGIRANVICPAMTQTAMLNGVSEDQLAAICETIPLRRLARPSEVAGACLFLASELSSFITGGNARRQRWFAFSLGSGPIKCGFEASKWQRYRSKVHAADSRSTGKGILFRDRSHFGVPSGFDPFCPLLRWQTLTWNHQACGLPPCTEQNGLKPRAAFNRS